MNSLDAPQFALTQALVDEKRTIINNYSKYIWPDSAQYKGNVYTDREPGLSLLATPFYFAAKIFLPVANAPYLGNHSGITQDSRLEALTYGLFSSVVALAPIILFLISRRMGYSLVASLMSAFFLGVGSLLWKYSASFVRQPFILVFLLGLFFIDSFLSKKQSIKFFFIQSLVLGYLVITDHMSIFPVLLFLVLLGSKFIRSKQFKKNKFVAIISGFSIPVVIFLLYNQISFGNMLTSPRYYSSLPGMKSTSNIFLADLRWSIPLNLISFRPIPQEAFHFFKNYPDLAETFSMYKWASVWTYRGIFIQSPILFLSLIGFFFIKNKRMVLLLLLLFLSYFIPASKILVFFSPTAYDTRYVLPAVGFLFIGLPAFLDFINKQKSATLRFGLWSIVAMLGIASIFQNLVSVSQHFAPHVSGEHRFDLVGSLVEPRNLQLILTNAFPNIYNLHIVVLYLISLYFLVKAVQSIVLKLR